MLPALPFFQIVPKLCLGTPYTKSQSIVYFFVGANLVFALDAGRTQGSPLHVNTFLTATQYYIQLDLTSISFPNGNLATSKK